jgi:uncharacterized membrane protein
MIILAPFGGDCIRKQIKVQGSTVDNIQNINKGSIPIGLKSTIQVFANRIPVWTLVTIALLFSILFIADSIRIHDVLGTSAYDLGLFDQAFWLNSKLLSSFNTVRGMKIMGDHFSPIAYVFAPLYQIWPDIAWALAMQTLSVTMGGIILFYIVAHLLPGKPWLGLAVVAAYYLNPLVHNTLLWQYHELVLASGLYMLLIWSYLKDRYRLYLVSMVLLLMCREDMPFTLAAFGVLAFIEKRGRYGWGAILLSVLWWILATRVAIPYFNGIGYFRHTNGVLSTLFANIANPAFYFERLLDPHSIRYLLQVFLPIGLLGLFSPRYLIPALPTLATNVLVGAYNVDIAYHYQVSIVPFLFWAAIMTIKKVDAKWADIPRTALISTMAAVLLLGSFWLFQSFSVVNVKAMPQQYLDWKNTLPKREFLKNLNEEFGNDGVAASDFLLPHLAHRQQIYLFPNPWQIHYWGVAGESPHHPNEIKHIVLDADVARQYARLYDYLIESGTFEKVTEKYGIVVLNRIKPEDPDRIVAINNYNHYAQVAAPAFTNVSLSPAFSTPINRFEKLDVNLSELQKHMPAGGKLVGDLAADQTLTLELGEDGKSDFLTRYVRTELNAKEAVKATLDLGSDDGVTIWLNQHLIHQNLNLHPATLGAEHVSFILKPGKNVVVFRVNNATGAWRLLARLKAQRCAKECFELAQN